MYRRFNPLTLLSGLNMVGLFAALPKQPWNPMLLPPQPTRHRANSSGVSYGKKARARALMLEEAHRIRREGIPLKYMNRGSRERAKALGLTKMWVG
jgi:hypothetical protein